MPFQLLLNRIEKWLLDTQGKETIKGNEFLVGPFELIPDEAGEVMHITHVATDLRVEVDRSRRFFTNALQVSDGLDDKACSVKAKRGAIFLMSDNFEDNEGPFINFYDRSWDAVVEKAHQEIMDKLAAADANNITAKQET